MEIKNVWDEMRVGRRMSEREEIETMRGRKDIVALKGCMEYFNSLIERELP